jgi:hypothetical protein
MMNEEYGSHLVCVRLRSRNFIFTEFLLWELGYPAQVMSGSSTLQGELGDSILLYCVCGPFAARGAEGEEEYP